MANPQSAFNDGKDERQRNRLRLARLEANIAYFQARLEMIGDPLSTNQIAQRKVFKLLHQSTSGEVLEAKQTSPDST